MVDTNKYPLPDGVADADVNRAQLAEALGVSEPTIDRFRKEGLPVVPDAPSCEEYARRMKLNQSFLFCLPP